MVKDNNVKIRYDEERKLIVATRNGIEIETAPKIDENSLCNICMRLRGCDLNDEETQCGTLKT